MRKYQQKQIYIEGNHRIKKTQVNSLHKMSKRMSNFENYEN